jgi:hypothetical protein
VTLTELLALLPGHRAANGQYTAPCPAHADVVWSLAVKQGPNGLAVFCHAGCRTEAVLAALGKTMADLLGRPPEPNGEPMVSLRGGGAVPVAVVLKLFELERRGVRFTRVDFTPHDDTVVWVVRGPAHAMTHEDEAFLDQHYDDAMRVLDEGADAVKEPC